MKLASALTFHSRRDLHALDASQSQRQFRPHSAINLGAVKRPVANTKSTGAVRSSRRCATSCSSPQCRQVERASERQIRQPSLIIFAHSTAASRLQFALSRLSRLLRGCKSFESLVGQLEILEACDSNLIINCNIALASASLLLSLRHRPSCELRVDFSDFSIMIALARFPRNSRWLRVSLMNSQSPASPASRSPCASLPVNSPSQTQFQFRSQVSLVCLCC